MEENIDNIGLWIRQTFFENVTDEEFQQLTDEFGEYLVFVVDTLDKKGIPIEKITFDDVKKLFDDAQIGTADVLVTTTTDTKNEPKTALPKKDAYSDQKIRELSSSKKVSDSQMFLLWVVILVIGFSVIKNISKWGGILIFIVYAILEMKNQGKIAKTLFRQTIELPTRF